MSILHLEKENLQEIVGQGVTLVDFYAEWCGPCKMLAPMLEKVSEKRSNVKIVKVDVDKCLDLAQSFNIMSVPTLFLFKNGKVIDTRQGFQTTEMLTEWIDRNI